MKLTKAFSLSLILLLITTSQSYALKFFPFRANFAPSGSESNKLFFAENNSEEKIAVQVSAQSYQMDKEGKELNSQTDEFVIYPQQMIIEPGKRRAIRVQWVGEADLKIEKAYRIIAEQLPVNLDSQTVNNNEIKLMVNYRGMVFVTPKQSYSDLGINYQKIKKDDTYYLKLLFNNKGTRHIRIYNPKLSIFNKNGKSLHYDARNQLLETVDKGLILAKTIRYFYIPISKELFLAIKNVKFDFDQNI